MQKEQQTFEHIGQLTEDFQRSDADQWTPQDGSWWQVRVLLAIAQQLAVISGHLKALNDEAAQSGVEDWQPNRREQ
jgi:hypothetical protein